MTSQDLVHQICHFIREEIEIATGDHTHCKGCELRVESPYGPGTPGCVLRAQRLIALVRESRDEPRGECICPTCGLRHGGSNVDGGF